MKLLKASLEGLLKCRSTFFFNALPTFTVSNALHRALLGILFKGEGKGGSVELEVIELGAWGLEGLEIANFYNLLRITLILGSYIPDF